MPESQFTRILVNLLPVDAALTAELVTLRYSFWPMVAFSFPDPKAEEWAQKNEWFGSDEVMTYAAFGLHRKLVEDEGFDPTEDSYYSELDRRIRAEFPQKFQTKKSGGAQVAPAGASATRTTAKQGRKSVKLSPSQVAMAKRLNVPLEEYAKYVKD